MREPFILREKAYPRVLFPSPAAMCTPREMIDLADAANACRLLKAFLETPHSELQQIYSCSAL